MNAPAVALDRHSLRIAQADGAPELRNTVAAATGFATSAGR